MLFLWMASNIQYGIDVFLPQLTNYQYHRFALVTNDAATTATWENSRMALCAKGFRIIKIFSPEHGLSAQGADGVFQDHTFDQLTGLPVTSLYGDHLEPTEEDLAGIDAVLFDIPDIGCRFYTYQWTLSYVMESCARFNKPLFVLDRPNPLGGNFMKAEGPMLDEAHCSSFIGRWNIPIRHSCTIGELANYWKQDRHLDLDLTVFKIQNWDRSPHAGPFVPTSPGIPDLMTAFLYPGMGLLEGINVSEGRGTTSPFKICGSPWINGPALAKSFNHLSLPGIKALPFSFQPAWGKYANENCHGLMLIVTDPEKLQPVFTGLSLLNLLCNEYGEMVQQHFYTTRANPRGEGHLNKLIGQPDSFGLVNRPPGMFQGQLTRLTSCTGWMEKITPFRLY